MVYYAQWLSIVAVAVLQFNNLMIYGGLLFAFLPPAILLNRFEVCLEQSSGGCTGTCQSENSPFGQLVRNEHIL